MAISAGFNPVASFPNKNKVIGCLSKLKFLVTIDPLNTETSNFWQNHGELNEVDSSKIQTEVFRLPSTLLLQKRTVQSLTQVAGCSGTGKVRTPRGLR